MLRGALTTPTRTDDAAGVLVIGTVVTLLAWTITPAWLVVSLAFPPALAAAPLVLAPVLVARGYYVRVVAEGIADGNADGAPSFVAWGRLYRDGLKSLLLSVLLLLPLAALAALAVAAGAVVELDLVDPEPAIEGAAGTDVGDSEATTALLGLAGGLVGVLSVGYLALFAYVRPAALALFADSGRLRDGLRPGRLLPVLSSGDYAVGWTLAMVTLLTGYALAVPFVPLLVGIGVVFATRIVAHALYGRGAATAVRGSETSGTSVAGVADAASEAGKRPSVSADDDDGWRSHRSHPRRLGEAPPDVQTGRSVPLGGPTEPEPVNRASERDATADGAVTADRQATSDPEATAFEWAPAVDREEPAVDLEGPAVEDEEPAVEGKESAVEDRGSPPDDRA